VYISKKINSSLWIFSALIVTLSFFSLLINHFFFQYPGNNYFPDNTLYIGLTLLLFYFGASLLFTETNRVKLIAKELLYLYGVMCMLALATNAIQLTPFHPIDAYIIAFEAEWHIHVGDMLTWTHQHPSIYNLLGRSYDSLSNQMCIIPLLLILSGRFHLLREYYFLLLFTALLGFTFYYFFPTTAPASMIQNPLFNEAQLATGLKFNQIQAHIQPQTMEGGMIALPSFHTVWALLCLYLLKEWPIVWFIVLPINILLIVACVLLGWHYPTDIVAGIVLTLVAYMLLRWCKQT